MVSFVSTGLRYSSGLLSKFDWGVLGSKLTEQRGDAKVASYASQIMNIVCKKSFIFRF